MKCAISTVDNWWRSMLSVIDSWWRSMLSVVGNWLSSVLSVVDWWLKSVLSAVDSGWRTTSPACEISRKQESKKRMERKECKDWVKILINYNMLLAINNTHTLMNIDTEVLTKVAEVNACISNDKENIFFIYAK